LAFARTARVSPSETASSPRHARCRGRVGRREHAPARRHVAIVIRTPATETPSTARRYARLPADRRKATRHLTRSLEIGIHVRTAFDFCSAAGAPREARLAPLLPPP